MSEEEIVYSSLDGFELGGVIYRPEQKYNETVIVDVHGGAWSSGNRYNGAYYDQAIADAGFVVFAIDFRDGRNARHPAATADITAAIRFLRSNCEDLGFGSDQIGLLGSSSGGHLALLAGLRPNADEHLTTPVMRSGKLETAPEVDASVDFVVALWPVSNPLDRYHYALSRLDEDTESLGSFTPDRLAAGHLAYYGDEKAMIDATIQRILALGEFEKLPPIFVVQPELDQNVPVFMSQTLVGAYRKAGGDACYKLYHGVGHGFAYAESATATTCIADIINYIKHRQLEP